MTDNVIPLGCITRLDLPTERILDEAKKWVSGGVIVIAYDKTGGVACASSIADGGEVLWMMEWAKMMLMDPEGYLKLSALTGRACGTARSGNAKSGSSPEQRLFFRAVVIPQSALLFPQNSNA